MNPFSLGLCPAALSATLLSLNILKQDELGFEFSIDCNAIRVIMGLFSMTVYSPGLWVLMCVSLCLAKLGTIFS